MKPISTPLILLFLTALVFGSQPDVNKILDKMEENESPKTARVEMTQTVVQPGGRESVSKLISFSAGEGEKGLMEYTAPARIEGMKILTLNDGDDIWFHSARTGRVRKIASHQKNQSVNGSDFSYEDLSTSDRREDYDAKLLGVEDVNGHPSYKVEMTAKNKDEIYPRIIFWVDTSNYVGRKAHFFDEDDRLWKKLTVENVKRVGEYYTPEKIIMSNVMKGSHTEMKMDKVEYDIDIKETMFSQRNLKR